MARNRVSAIVTEYRRHSHADVNVSKILEGYLHDGKEFPNLQLVSLHVNQCPPGDLSRDLAKKLGYVPFEGYGFHALEGLQCMVERRKGAETGVVAVTCLQGEAMWKALDRGDWSKELLEAALPLIPAHAKGELRELTTRDPQA